MKLYRQIISIILFILVLAVLVIPTLEGIPAYIIKAAIIGLLTVVLLKFSLTVANHDTSLDMESENEFSWLTLSDAKISDAVQNKYQQLLDFIIESIKSINPGYFTAIYMQDVKSGGYTVQKSSAQDFRDFLSHDNKLVNAVLAGSKLSVNQRSDNKTDWDKIFSTRTWRGSETLMSAPIYFKNRNRGFILVLADHFSNIQEKDKDILSSLTNFISFGMEDLEILENLRMDNYFQSRLTNLFDSLEEKSDEMGLFESVRGLCRTFFKYDKLTISLIEESRETARVKLVDGMQEDTPGDVIFTLNESIHGISAAQNKSVLSNNWREEYPDLIRFEPEDDKNYQFSAFLSSPIKSKKDLKGMITIESLKSSYTASDQHFLEILAGSAGSILSWQEEYKLVHLNSIKDGLTGLLNHKALMDRFNEEITRAKRFNQMMTCLLLDLDKFKNVNDTYGHLFGDYVLKNVAEILKDSVRTIDVVGRYGGEEFVVLLINTDVRHSMPVAERIVKNMAKFNFSHNGISIHNTISGGIAGYPEDADGVQDLVNKADMAMYRSKANGRNQVTIYK